MLYAIFAVLVIILDQGVKYWVSGAIHMESAGETFIPGILSIINVHNDGAAFSFLAGSNARIYFIQNTELRKEITESTNVICKHYGIPVIQLKDIEKKSGHPNQKGMKAICEQVLAALR